MKHLPVWRKGRVVALALVDDADAQRFGEELWTMNHMRYVACRRSFPGRRTRQSAYVYLHREILGLPRLHDGREGDHLNRDRLDCRRANLRIVTRAQNLQNKGAYRGGVSAHRGVYWHKDKRRWVGVVQLMGRKTSRRFKTEAEAAAYAAGLRAKLMPFSEEAMP